MISTDRLLMQQQIYNFLRTITIKFDPIAQYVNSTVAAKGYPVNDLDPASWKYYLNLQGKYHASDTPMYVTSLDTQQTILFSPEVLAVHPRTRSVYVPGGLYYNRLKEIYPEQVDLIKSILFPITDVEKAINADDLVLLGYGSGYLEDYEEPLLIMEIEKFLAILTERWYFDFLNDEPYFYLTFWGSLPTYLAMLLMSTRESYIRTPYVHTFHLWNELKAKGLDDYSDILDRKKAMLLYNNIGYLKENAGKQSNLIILVDGLLSDFGVSLYGRKIVQESETGAENYQLTPQLQAIRIPTNIAAVTTEIANETVETIQSQVFEKGLTTENTSEAAEAKERRLGDTTLNSFMTKFLEIRPITKNKVYSDDLNMFILETLVTAIIRGYYTQPVNVEDPATGASIYLAPRELLALYHYAVQKSMGLSPTKIPNRAFLYKAFTTEIGTPTKTIKRGEETVYVSSHVNAAAFLSGLHYDTNLEDPNQFSEMLTRLWLRYIDHLLADQDTKIDRRSYILHYLGTLCHQRRVESFTLVPGFTTYENWLGLGGIDIASSILAQYDVQIDAPAAWGNLADSIISALVPITTTLASFGNFTLTDFGYSRLRQLFVQMCSYRVVFLESSRETPKFAVGSKWSTLYGPDAIQTYSDRGILRYQRSTDGTHRTDAFALNPGFCELREMETTAAANYTVNSTLELGAIGMAQGQDRNHISPHGTSRFISRGTFTAIYGGIQILGVTDTEGDSLLADSDGYFFIDDDGIMIVDPNTTTPEQGS